MLHKCEEAYVRLGTLGGYLDKNGSIHITCKIDCAL